MVKKRYVLSKTWKKIWKKPGRNSKNSKNLEEIQKTLTKFPKIFWPPCMYSRILGSSEIIPSNVNSYSLPEIKRTIESVSKSLVNVGCIKVDNYQALVQVEICMDKQFNTIDCDDSYSNKRGKIVWKPTLKSIYPCHYNQEVLYMKI